MSAPNDEPSGDSTLHHQGEDVAYSFPNEPLCPLIRGTAPVADDPVAGRVPFDAEKALHKSREDIARLVLILFAGVLVGGMVLFILASFTQLGATEAKDAFLAVFTPMVGIVSGMLGYYYRCDTTRQ